MQCLDEEALGRLGVACRAQEELERVPVRIDCPVEVRPCPFDLDVGFIYTPGVIRSFEVRPAALLQIGGIVLYPAVK